MKCQAAPHLPPLPITIGRRRGRALVVAGDWRPCGAEQSGGRSIAAKAIATERATEAGKSARRPSIAPW